MQFRNIEPQRVAAWVSGTCAAVSVILGVFEFDKPFDKASSVKVAQAIVLGLWVIGPPIWFWWEHYFYWKRHPVAESFEEFTRGQDQSAKIWLALVTVLLGMYFGKDITEAVGRNPSPPDPQSYWGDSIP